MRHGLYDPEHPLSAEATTLVAPQQAVVALADAQSRADWMAGDEHGGLLPKAIAFARPLLENQELTWGEDAWHHACSVAEILASLGASPPLQASAFLVYAGDYLAKPQDVLEKAFGASAAQLVMAARALVKLQHTAAGASEEAERGPEQIERVRKMLLAFSKDLRVVLLRLASRLATLRHYALLRRTCPPILARETLEVYAPLANRLGIWQVKWELEDLAFRFLMPQEYHFIASALKEKRLQREQDVLAMAAQLELLLRGHGIDSQVHGRPKHLYSIWRKMQGKHLSFDQVMDVRAMRVIVHDVPACYAALSHIHDHFQAVDGELDDYIAKPKANGYQSLHTVVLDHEGRSFEVQIRTGEMHQHAESGVAAHWAYKEAGAKGYAGVQASADAAAQLADARKRVLRQLLAWEQDYSSLGPGLTDSADLRIYVFTPQATIVELPVGATAIDFAYAVHTSLGHRCRGAKIDGAMVPLVTPLQSGQTVEVLAAKDGGPSLDWLNPELGYVRSMRARSKVRAWFNAEATARVVARGREAVEKLLQREGRTAIRLEDLAGKLGFKKADDLFEVVGKDEFSLRHIEQLIRPPEPAPAGAQDVAPRVRAAKPGSGQGGVLVVGVDSLLTQLARCCRPAPPDAIVGYVTRGKGIAVHRSDCASFRHMNRQHPERVIQVAWGGQKDGGVYPVDIAIEAHDRQGLLRDITEVFAKEKANVVGMHTQTVRSASGEVAYMTLTVETPDAARVGGLLRSVMQVAGVTAARRK